MTEWLLHNKSKIIQVLSGRSNVYLIQSGTNSILIDTGKKNVRTALVSKLKKLGVTNLNWLILTHTHFDHCQNAAFLKKEFNARIIVSKRAEQSIKQGYTPLPSGTNAFSKIILNFGKKLGATKFSYETFKVDNFINSETILEDKTLNIRILPTPGHSSDSISIVVNNEIAFVGDTLFGIFPNSVFPPYANEPQQLSMQWEKLYDTGCSVFLPGHGRPIPKKLLKKCLLKLPNENA